MFINLPQCILNDQATDNKIHEILSHFFAYSFHNLMIVLLSQQYKESNDFPISGVYSGFCYIKRLHCTVRNIPKFKDRANWSHDTFQPMRGRACVYQQTNQNIAPVIKNFQNSGRSRTELKMSLQDSSRFHI